MKDKSNKVRFGHLASDITAPRLTDILNRSEDIPKPFTAQDARNLYEGTREENALQMVLTRIKNTAVHNQVLVFDSEQDEELFHYYFLYVRYIEEYLRNNGFKITVTRLSSATDPVTLVGISWGEET